MIKYNSSLYCIDITSKLKIKRISKPTDNNVRAIEVNIKMTPRSKIKCAQIPEISLPASILSCSNAYILGLVVYMLK